MKRMIHAMSFLLCICLCGCTCTGNISATETTEMKLATDLLTSNKDIIYGEGQFEEDPDAQPGYLYDGDVLPDKDAALSVATAIFENMDKPEEIKDHVPQMVYLDVEDNLWIVSFWEKEYGPNMLDGYSTRIVLNKKDGAVRYIQTPVPVS